MGRGGAGRGARRRTHKRAARAGPLLEEVVLVRLRQLLVKREGRRLNHLLREALVTAGLDLRASRDGGREGAGEARAGRAQPVERRCGRLASVGRAGHQPRQAAAVTVTR